MSAVFFTSRSPDLFSAGLFPHFINQPQRQQQPPQLRPSSVNGGNNNNDVIRYQDIEEDSDSDLAHVTVDSMTGTI